MGGQRRHEAPFETLPDGAFVVDGEAAFLVLGGAVAAVDARRVHDGRPRPRGHGDRADAAVARCGAGSRVGGRRAAAPSVRL